MSITEYNLMEYKEVVGYPLSKFLAEHKLKVSVCKKPTGFVVRLSPRVYYTWIDQICSGEEEVSFKDCNMYSCFERLVQFLRNKDEIFYYITGKHKVWWWWVNDSYSFRGRRDLVIDEDFLKYAEITHQNIVKNRTENKVESKLEVSDIGSRVLEL